MLGVLFYESADDVVETAPVHFAAHSAYADAHHEAGDLLWLGTFADPVADGSMAVFVSPDAAEAFATDDPFVLNGVVKSWRVLAWNEVYAAEVQQR